jgi:hypothetical protein
LRVQNRAFESGTICHLSIPNSQRKFLLHCWKTFLLFENKLNGKINIYLILWEISSFISSKVLILLLVKNEFHSHLIGSPNFSGQTQFRNSWGIWLKCDLLTPEDL